MFKKFDGLNVMSIHADTDRHHFVHPLNDVSLTVRVTVAKAGEPYNGRVRIVCDSHLTTFRRTATARYND